MNARTLSAARPRPRGALAALALAVCLAPALPAGAQMPDGDERDTCGGSTIVTRGDTLSSIAQRCRVPEAMLIAANPAVLGSGDLQIGATIRTAGPSAAALKLAQRFNDLAADAATALGRAAGSLDGSMRDLFDRDPDLKSRMGRLADQFGLGGSAAPTPAPVAIRLAPVDGAPGTVKVTATGLPKDSAVIIGAGPPQGAYAAVTAARSSATGTLEETVQLPDWLSGPAVVVVRDDANDVTARATLARP